MSLEDAARRAIEAALAAGASDAEAWAEESTSRRIRVYDGEVESLSDAGGRGLGLRAFAGARSGYAYGTDLSEESVAELARGARESAEVADEDEHAGLPDENGSSDVDGLASPGLATWSTERKVALALAIERAARARDGVTQVENAVYSDRARWRSPTRAASPPRTQPRRRAYASAFAGEGADLMTGLEWGSAATRTRSTPRPSAARRRSGRSRWWAPASRRAGAARCARLLRGGVLRRIHRLDALRGRGPARALAVRRPRGRGGGRPRARHRGRRRRRGRLGERAVRRRGLAHPAHPLVEGGRLLGYLYDVRTARRAGKATTGNAGRSSYRSPPAVSSTNLVLEPGSEDLAGLVRLAGDGLYVTQVAGLHSGVNPVRARSRSAPRGG